MNKDLEKKVAEHLAALTAEAVGLAFKICETEKAADINYLIGLSNALVATALCRQAPDAKTLKVQVRRSIEQFNIESQKQVNSPQFLKSAAHFIEALKQAEAHVKH